MICKKEIYRGYQIEIHYDEGGESPREWDNLGIMICFHSKYNLGDEGKININIKEFGGWPELEEYICKEYKPILILPLYLYDHSGITMNTTGYSCSWDSGQVGYIIVTRGSVRKRMGWKRITEKRKKKLEENLIREVETYDQYLRGDVYGYNIPEIGDRCYGFYGDDFEANGLMDEAKGCIDYVVQGKEVIAIPREKGEIMDEKELREENTELREMLQRHIAALQIARRDVNDNKDSKKILGTLFKELLKKDGRHAAGDKKR